MRKYTSNQDFYDHINEVMKYFRSSGLSDKTDKINYLLHNVAWTTSSELFGELRIEFVKLLKSKRDLPQDYRDIINHFVQTIDKTLN